MSGKNKTFKRNGKLDKIYNVESGLVVNSSKEKIVIGRLENGEFISLDEKTLELCEEYGFDYDKSLVDIEEEESSKEQDKAQDSEEEETPKKKSPESKKKSEVSAECASKTSPDSHLQSFSALVQKQNKELHDFVHGMSSTSTSSEKVAELESALAATKSELDELKKKYKKLLTTMAEAV